MPPRSLARFALLASGAATVVVAATLLGPTPLSWEDICQVSVRPWFTGEAPTQVFWHIRVPRTLLGAVAGAGLAIGGVVLQALFRNPLAEPYTLGLASGASLAAACGFLFLPDGARGNFVGIPTLVLCAFLGAAGAMALVYGLSRVRAGRDTDRLLLAGVCVAYLCAAGVLLIFFFSDRAVTLDTVFWMMGALGRQRPQAIFEILLVLVPTLVFVAWKHRALDLLALSDDVAATRGVSVGRVMWGSYVLVGTLTAVIVANCGPIGFVGLMIPHISRALFGVRTLPLLLGGALLGAAFLSLCDGLARLLPQADLPVGVVTNVLGAAFFFYLLATRDVAHTAVRN